MGEAIDKLQTMLGEDFDRDPECLFDALNEARVEVLEQVAAMAETRSRGLSRNPRLALQAHARAVRKLIAELGGGN
jgi:hypothetical protein